MSTLCSPITWVFNLEPMQHRPMSLFFCPPHILVLTVKKEIFFNGSVPVRRVCCKCCTWAKVYFYLYQHCLTSPSLSQRDICRGMAACCRRPCSWTTCGGRCEWPEHHRGEKETNWADSAQQQSGSCCFGDSLLVHCHRSRKWVWAQTLTRFM